MSLENTEKLNDFQRNSLFVDELKRLYVEKILSEDKEKEYRKAFQTLDVNGNGTLRKNELLYALQVNEIGINLQEQQMLLRKFSDRNQEIDYNDFIISIMQDHEIQNSEVIDQMFYYLKEQNKEVEFVRKQRLLNLMINSNNSASIKIINEQVKTNKISKKQFQSLIKEILE